MTETLSGKRELVSIVVPVYRSEGCIEPLFNAIDSSFKGSSASYELILVNDFSPDNSWQRIVELCAREKKVIGINLRKNFGQDCAIMTGLRHLTGDYVVIMDDDLQHDPTDILRLLEKIREGHDIVYANFETKHQKFWKNLGSWFNGKVAELVIGKPKHIYLSPFKIIRRDVTDRICNYDGPDPYIDGLLFQQTAYIDQIEAVHRRRLTGESNYTFMRSIRVWARLAFGFSVFPLRIVTVTGVFLCAISIFIASILAWQKLTTPSYPIGYASIIDATLFLGGVQAFSLGVLGEYIGRSFLKLNRKPQTSILEVLNQSN